MQVQSDIPWCNFRQTHSDNITYGDLDPRFLEEGYYHKSLDAPGSHLLKCIDPSDPQSRIDRYVLISGNNPNKKYATTIDNKFGKSAKKSSFELSFDEISSQQLAPSQQLKSPSPQLKSCENSTLSASPTIFCAGTAMPLEAESNYYRLLDSGMNPCSFRIEDKDGTWSQIEGVVVSKRHTGTFLVL